MAALTTPRPLLAALLFAGVVANVVAGPYEDADAAFKSGDYATAMRLWRPLADAGSARAQYSVGMLHSYGLGVAQSHPEALRWYRLAAERGYPRAQYHLGTMLQNGRGIRADAVQAYMWFEIAGGRFPPRDRSWTERTFAARNALAAKMTPAQIAEAQRLAKAWKPKVATEPQSAGPDR